MRNPPIRVKILDANKKGVSDAAQRIVNSLREVGWEGDVEMISLLGSFLDQCGSTINIQEDETYKAYFDGSSKGNPGPSHIGYIILDSSGKVVISISEKIEDGTNNEAEYKAVIALLGKLCELKVRNVLIQGDSKLVVNQLVGAWKIKKQHLKELAEEAFVHLDQNPGWKLEWVPREKNELADKLAQKR